MDPLTVLDLTGRLIVAGALGWAALAKLADLPGLRATLYLSRFTRPWVPQLTVVLPLVELTLAAALALARPARGTALAAGLLLVLFTAYLATDPHAGEGCNCFGRRPRASQAAGASRRSGIVRDLLLLAALGPALAVVPPRRHLGVPERFEVAFALVAALTIGAALVVAFDTDRRSRRSGRRRAGTPPTPPPNIRRQAPAFDLPALDGSRVGTAPLEFLLFVEAGCDLCERLLPEVADRADVVILAAGDPLDVAALAARHHLEPGRVGLDEDGAVADAFAVPGTPAAARISPEGLLVDAAGLPAPRLAVGPDAARALLGAAPS